MYSILSLKRAAETSTDPLMPKDVLPKSVALQASMALTWLYMVTAQNHKPANSCESIRPFFENTGAEQIKGTNTIKLCPAGNNEYF